MKAQILEVGRNVVLNASILVWKRNSSVALPSLTDGWRFNFSKHARKNNFQTYVLCCDHTSDIIEGCLIFEMRDQIEPYMAYVEVAPYNRGETKQRDNVAGCLIAFACRLSFIHGKGDYHGWLAFDVLEESKEDEMKLMAVYSSKYGALKFGETTMVIPPEGGQKLIDEFLNP